MPRKMFYDAPRRSRDSDLPGARDMPSSNLAHQPGTVWDRGTRDQGPTMAEVLQRLDRIEQALVILGQGSDFDDTPNPDAYTSDPRERRRDDDLDNDDPDQHPDAPDPTRDRAMRSRRRTADALFRRRDGEIRSINAKNREFYRGRA